MPVAGSAEPVPICKRMFLERPGETVVYIRVRWRERSAISVDAPEFPANPYRRNHHEHSPCLDPDVCFRDSTGQLPVGGRTRAFPACGTEPACRRGRSGPFECPFRVPADPPLAGGRAWKRLAQPAGMRVASAISRSMVPAVRASTVPAASAGARTEASPAPAPPRSPRAMAATTTARSHSPTERSATPGVATMPMVIPRRAASADCDNPER